MYRLYRVISFKIVYIVRFCFAKIEYRCKKFVPFHKMLHQICTKIIAPTQSKKTIKNSSVFFRFTLLSSHLKNEVIFKALCYFLLVLLKNMTVSIGRNCNITMAQMLGNRFDINAVIYHKTCIAMTETVYTDNRHIIACKDFFEFLVYI